MLFNTERLPENIWKILKTIKKDKTHLQNHPLRLFTSAHKNRSVTTFGSHEVTRFAYFLSLNILQPCHFYQALLRGMVNIQGDLDYGLCQSLQTHLM